MCPSCVVANADGTLRAVIFYCELGVCSLVCLSCVIADADGFLRATEKPCLKRPLKNRQNKDLNENGCLMKVKSIAECSKGSILQYF